MLLLLLLLLLLLHSRDRPSAYERMTPHYLGGDGNVVRGRCYEGEGRDDYREEEVDGEAAHPPATALIVMVVDELWDVAVAGARQEGSAEVHGLMEGIDPLMMRRVECKGRNGELGSSCRPGV
jgi:hypothetical protein